MTEQGRKFDGGKLRYDLVPVLAHEDQVKGLTYGVTKYDDNNWRVVPEGRKRYLAAAMRHIQEYRKGNLWDHEQEIHHLSAAINNFSFIVEKDLQGWEDVPEQVAEEVTKDITQEKPQQCERCDEGWLPWPFSADKKGSPCHICKAGDDWVVWNGGGCPPLSVSGDTFVKLLLSCERTENDTTCQVYRVEEADWENHGNNLDIVAYKIIPNCECCGGCGTIDETLGGYAFSNPKATCPDCQGDGYVEIKEKG